jgi:PAS domain S-box-containing protein
MKAKSRNTGKGTNTESNSSKVNASKEWRDQDDKRVLYLISLMDNITDALISTDIKFNILEWNAAAESIYGWKATEVTGHPLQEFIQTEYVDDTPEEATKVVLEQGNWRGEVTQNRKDGTRFPVMASVSLVKDETGEPIGFVAINREITERVRVEKQFTQIKRLYATLSQVNQTIVRVKDRDELYRSICNVAVQFGKFSLAWIGLLDEATGDVRPAAARGLEVTQWPFPIVNIHKGDLKNSLIATAIRTSRVMTSEDIEADNRLQSLYGQIQRYAYHATAALPFRLRGKTIGILSLVSSEIGLFKAEEEELRLLWANQTNI